ncbi:hypothetical protein VDGD_20427 [Verticillium dahliae]|nr:hypothetical protein VDGD_20427 [Verticillium dahliae]
MQQSTQISNFSPAQTFQAAHPQGPTLVSDHQVQQYLIQPDAVSVRPDALQVPVSDKKVLVAVYGRPWAEETAQVS